MRTNTLLLGLWAISMLPLAAAEIVVYGGTPGGIAAAATAARAGHTVTLVEPSRHLGGVISGGLTRTDVGDGDTIGGFAREFFDRCEAWYAATYGAESDQVKASRHGYYMEPHVAEEQFAAMLTEAGVEVLLGWHVVAAERDLRPMLVAMTCADAGGQQRRFVADGFVDASYEGDLMAAALVPYRVGREATSEYGEEHAGIRVGESALLGQGDHRTQAYNFRLCLTEREDLKILPSQPANYDPARYQLLLQGILATKPPEVHNYILNCMPVANGKFDANNNGATWQSTDYVGANHAYPEADWETRQKITQAHLEYVQGLLYFIQNDPEVPEYLRTDARRYGLASDEFKDHDHWPHQLYVRECRRMVGQYVFREQDARAERYKADGIGVGSYTIDSHGVRLVASPTPGRGVSYDGGLGVRIKPYEIPYGVLVPLDLGNLLVPVCCSATHVGYATLRMEPVYMILGHAAGAALDQALRAGVPVQQVDVPTLRQTLLEQQAIVDAPWLPQATIDCSAGEAFAPGTTATLTAVPVGGRTKLVDYWWDFDGDAVVDATGPTVDTTFAQAGSPTVWMVARDENNRLSNYARLTLTVGEAGPVEVFVHDEDRSQFSTHRTWDTSSQIGGFVGDLYHHDNGDQRDQRAWRFKTPVAREGRYRVLLGVVPAGNRATNCPVTIIHADGETKVTADMRADRGVFPWLELGTYRFAPEPAASVLIQTAGADGYVVVDSLRLVPVTD